ncbi:MAG: hypothetical protein HGA96_13855 [Desulfobulbaceae bacterium]|nr:hypothetical protein [Desulfobulbaceae bacterium]
MITSPAVIALQLASLLIAGMLLYAAYFAGRILRGWDRDSGSDAQLALERRTYLVSSLLALALAFQLASIFLFIHTVDALHSRFVGAMCAAGVLNINGFGYPTLILKVVNFLLAGLWLIVNRVDNRAYDYPLIRKKYLLLLLIAPLLLTEAVLQGAFFLGLRPDVITSCCGSLFGGGGQGVVADLAALPLAPAVAIFTVAMSACLGSGTLYWLSGRGGPLFSLLSGVTLLVMVAALISFISLYFYEIPTHHCPFCLLQSGYTYIGYPLYLAMLGGGVCGLAVGVLQPFRRVASLTAIIPPVQRRLTLWSLILYLLFTIIVLVRIFTTPFTLRP